MRKKRGGARRWLSLSTFAVLAGVTAALLLRTNVALLSTQGSSMAPRFHSGDLAITLTSDRYAVGDIAAYRDGENGQIVLHRIVDASNGQYTFKGDNNDWTDPTKPTGDQLVGKLWVHLPKVGALVNLRSNTWRLIVLAIAAFLIFGGRTVHRRRRRRREEEGDDDRPKKPARISDLNDAPAALIVPCAVFLAALALVGICFNRAPSRETTKKEKFTQQVSYGYTGTAPTGTTYPDGTVSTGAPIFLKLVSSLRFQIAYELSAKKGEVHNSGGNYSIDAVISGVDSWTRTIPLQPSTNFEGAGFSTEVMIDIPQVRQIVRAAQAETGVTSDAVKVQLIPRVTSNGFVDEVPVSATFDTPLEMDIGTDIVTLAAKSRAPDGRITETETTPYKTTVSKANQFELFGRRLDVSRARTLSGTALALSVMWLAAVAVIQDRLRHRPEAVRIVHRYRSSIIEITAVAPPANAVDVANFAALVRIAEQGGRFILHHADRDADTFIVDDDGITYRYVVDRWSTDRGARVVERADLPPPEAPAAAPVVTPIVAPVAIADPPVEAAPAGTRPEAQVAPPDPVVLAEPAVAEPVPEPVVTAHVEEPPAEPDPDVGLVVASDVGPDDALFRALFEGLAAHEPIPVVAEVPAPTHHPGTPPPIPAPAPAAPTAVTEPVWTPPPLPEPTNGTIGSSAPPPFFGVAAPSAPPATLDKAIRLTALSEAERRALGLGNDVSQQ